MKPASTGQSCSIGGGWPSERIAARIERERFRLPAAEQQGADVGSARRAWHRARAGTGISGRIQSVGVVIT